jgi:predicted peptidase
MNASPSLSLLQSQRYGQSHSGSASQFTPTTQFLFQNSNDATKRLTPTTTTSRLQASPQQKQHQIAEMLKHANSEAMPTSLLFDDEDNDNNNNRNNNNNNNNNNNYNNSNHKMIGQYHSPNQHHSYSPYNTGDYSDYDHTSHPPYLQPNSQSLSPHPTSSSIHNGSSNINYNDFSPHMNYNTNTPFPTISHDLLPALDPSQHFNNSNFLLYSTNQTNNNNNEPSQFGMNPYQSR